MCPDINLLWHWSSEPTEAAEEPLLYILLSAHDEAGEVCTLGLTRDSEAVALWRW